ncbi:hypothetical protein DRH14_03985 [Candidatus Shapirobacteria bacterium]|nr:MAG: hypothetical protein DRH14_03985 [Candidatus Shapirobacteria bacterium]
MFRPKLVQTGVGRTLQCPICRKYFTANGAEISKSNLISHNPRDASNDDWDEYVGGFYMTMK